MPFFPQFSSLFVPPYVPFAGLKAYYKLDDDGSGGLSLIDSSGNGKTLTNDYSVTLGTGKINGCATFDGTQILSNDSLALGGGDFAISLWVNPSGENYYFPAFISTRNSLTSQGNQYGFGYSLDQGYDGIYWYDDASGEYEPFKVLNSYVPPDNEWTHVVATRKSGILTIYYNGGNPVSGANTNNYTYEITTIGGNIDINGNQNTTGRIDEIGIWGKSLTDDEISILYNGGSGKTYPFN